MARMHVSRGTGAKGLEDDLTYVKVQKVQNTEVMVR